MKGESLTLPTNGNIYIFNSTHDSCCLNLFQECGFPAHHTIPDYLEFARIVQLKTSFLCSLLGCLNYPPPAFKIVDIPIKLRHFGYTKVVLYFNATGNHCTGIGGSLTDYLTAVGLNVEVMI
jgi:hypothetical protein